MKSNVAVKLNPDPATESMEHHVRGCLENNSPNTSFIAELVTWKHTTIFNWYNEPGNIYKKQKENCSSLWYKCQNDKFKEKVKNVNSLLKGKCEEEKIVLVGNLKLYKTYSIFNYIELHLNEHGTKSLVSSSLAKWRYLICVDTTFKKWMILPIVKQM